MSITPGYDFGSTEVVTAAKLAAWVLGAVDPGLATAYTGEFVGVTAITSVSLANEGDLLYDPTRGTLEVQTRWGPTPVIGRGMFTRRIWFRAAGAPDNMLAFSGILGFGENMRQTMPSSTCSIEDVDWLSNFAMPYNQYNLYSSNPAECVYAPCIIQPTQGLLGSDDLTCISCLSNANHHLVQLRGFSPLAATHASDATYPGYATSGQWINIQSVSLEDVQKHFYRCFSKSGGADFPLASRIPIYFGPCIATHYPVSWFKYTL